MLTGSLLYSGQVKEESTHSAEPDSPLYLIFSRPAAVIALWALVGSPPPVDNPGDNRYILWDLHDECDCENSRMA